MVLDTSYLGRVAQTDGGSVTHAIDKGAWSVVTALVGLAGLRPQMQLYFYATKDDAWQESAMALGVLTESVEARDERRARAVKGPLELTILEAARMKIGAQFRARRISRAAP